MSSPHALPLLVLLLFSVWGMKALFHPGLYTAHDIWHQVARLYHYTQSLREGVIFPTWVTQLGQGYGYPLFIFSYHFPWMVGFPFVALGVSIHDTLKLLFFGSYVVSGISMYALGLALFRHRVAALLSAILYLWAPYHFLSVFVSAAIGTAFQFALLPLLFLGTHWLLTSRPRGGLLLTSFALSANVLTHLMTTVFIAPFWAAFIVFYLFKNKLSYAQIKRRVFLLAGAGVLALFLSAFYLLPFISNVKNIAANDYSMGFKGLYERNLVTFKQLVYSKWGYGPIVENAKDGEMSFQVGVAQWLVVALSVLLLLWKSKKGEHRGLTILLLSLFIVSIGGMLDQSRPFWKVAVNIVTLDYPFRLLLPAVFLSSLLSGYAMIRFRSNPLFMWATFLGLVVVALYTNRNHIRVNLYTDIPVAEYVNAELTTNTFNEYLPRGSNADLIKAGDKPDLLPLEYQPVSLERTVLTSHYIIELPKEESITLSEFEFPGQTVYLDGQLIKHQVDGSQRIYLTIPAGRHEVLRVFEDTPAILVGKLLSLFGLMLSAMIIKSKITNP